MDGNVKNDLLIVKTSQESYGRNKTKHILPTSKSSSQKSLHSSKTLKIQSKKESFLQTLQQNLIEPQTDSNLQEIHQIKQCFTQKLHEITQLKERAMEINQQSNQINYFRILLQMPNILQILFSFTCRIHKLKKHEAFKKWKHYLLVIQFQQTQQQRLEQRRMNQIKQLWKNSQTKQSLTARRIRKERLRRLKVQCSARIVCRFFRYYRTHREIYRQNCLLQEQKKEHFKQTKNAIVIQKVYKGWRQRKLNLDKLRLQLVYEMKKWGDGNIQKLLERSSMQDPRSYQMLLRVIAICSQSSRPLRSLPSKQVLQQAFQWMKRKQHLDSLQTNLLLNESHHIQQERRQMLHEDQLQHFQKYYQNVLDEFQLLVEKERKVKQKREIEEMRVRKIREETKNIIESVTSAGILERFERENMFRVECQQRVVEDILKRQMRKIIETENLLMMQEDKYVSKLQTKEREEMETNENKYNEMLRIRKALDEEMIYDSLSMSQGGRLQRRLIFPKQPSSSNTSNPSNQFPIHLQTTNVEEVIQLIQKGFESEDGSGRSAICDCCHDWKTTPLKMNQCFETIERIFRHSLTNLSQTFHFQASIISKPSHDKRITSSMSSIESITSCEIEAGILPDSFTLAKFKILIQLKHTRQLRHSLAFELSELLFQFNSIHVELVEIRHQLKHNKYSTRQERKESLQIAIEKENQLVKIEQRMIELNQLICENGRKEIKYFIKLFPVSKECYLFELIDKRRDPLQVVSEIDKELNSIDWKDEDTVFKDENASETSFLFTAATSSSSSSFPATTATTSSEEKHPTHHIPNWPRHYIDHLISIGFLPVIEEIKIVDHKPASKRKHYSRFAPMSGQYQYSKKKDKKPTSAAASETTNKQPDIVKAKTYRDIPGLGKYNVEHISETHAYQISLETKQWSTDLSKWFHQIEQQSKSVKFQLCLSFLQRARHLLNSGMRYCVVKSTDVRLAQVIQNANIFDLYQLLLCRGGISLKPLNMTANFIVEENHLSSAYCDAIFGKHPFSIWVYFYLLYQEEQLFQHSFSHTPENYHSPQLFLQSNLFASLHLLKLPKILHNDHLKFQQISKQLIQPSDPKRYYSFQEYEELKLHHLYSIEILASLMTAISQERNDYQNLLFSLGNDIHLRLVETIPHQKGSGHRNSLFKKSASNHYNDNHHNNNNNKSLKKQFSHQSSNDSNEDTTLKRILRIELSHEMFHLGILLRSYRNSTLIQSSTNSLFWSILPSWMYPVYYWGRNEKFSLTKRQSSVGGNEKAVILEEFEDRMTDWAENVVKKLKEKVNRKIYKQKQELEKSLLSIHQVNMEFEDKRSLVVRIQQKQQEEEKLSQLQSVKWYKKLFQCFHRQKISSYLPGYSPEDLKNAQNALQKAKLLLPKRMIVGDMSLLYQGYLGEYGVKGFRERHRTKAGDSQQVNKRNEHISWVSRDEWNDVENYNSPKRRKHGYVPRNVCQLLGEMLVGGGIRSVVFIARAIMDLENQPGGSSICEPMALYTMIEDIERVTYLRSCRLGFQDRQLCQVSHRSFAVTKSLHGKFVSEASMKRLRGTDRPKTELPSIDLRHKVIWKFFGDIRYQNERVAKVLPKFQSIVRMRQSKKRWHKIFKAKKKLIEEGKEILVNTSRHPAEYAPSSASYATNHHRNSTSQPQPVPSPSSQRSNHNNGFYHSQKDSKKESKHSSSTSNSTSTPNSSSKLHSNHNSQKSPSKKAAMSPSNKSKKL